MSRIAACLVLVPTLAAGLCAPAAASPPPAAISMQLEEAPAAQVLEGLATALGGRLSLDPTLAGKVTLDLREVSIPEALDATCRQLGCRWQVSEASPPVLRVTALPPAAELLDLALADADVRVVLATFSQVLGVEAEIAPEIRGILTIELEGAAWWEALDAVCRRAGCRWRYERTPPRLRIEAEPGRGATGAEPRLGRVRLAAPAVAPRQAVARPGGVGLALRLRGPGGEAAARDLAFTWERAVQEVGGPGGWVARVSWLPLGGGEGVVVPLLERCGRSAAAGGTIAFDPVRLPLAAPWIGEGPPGVALEILRSGAVRAAAARSPAPEPACRLAASPVLAVVLDRGRPAAYRQVLERPGDFVQLQGALSETAVIHLGRGAGGGAVAGILTWTGRAEMERVPLLPNGASWTATLPLADGTSITLAIEVV